MFQYLFEIIHLLLFLYLLILPYIASNKFINTYGFYISSFMTGVLFLWVILKDCPLNIFNKYNTEWGNLITFLNKRLSIKTAPYNKYIWTLITVLYSLSAFILAESHTYLKFAIIILTSLYFYLYYNTLGT